MPSPLRTTKQVVSCLLILAMVTVCVRSYAIDTQPAFSDPSIQARYLEL